MNGKKFTDRCLFAVGLCLFISMGCVQIDSPTDGSTFPEGEAITFSGSVLFNEEEKPTAYRSWYSSIDGMIGSEASFTRNDLSVGTHSITLTVSKNNWANFRWDDEITITVGVIWYKDADGDGYSDGTTQISEIRPSKSYYKKAKLRATSGDLDDNDSATSPGATEVCGDSKDNNCDGEVDEGCTYQDADGDGYGDPELFNIGRDPDDGFFGK